MEYQSLEKYQNIPIAVCGLYVGRACNPKRNGRAADLRRIDLREPFKMSVALLLDTFFLAGARKDHS